MSTNTHVPINCSMTMYSINSCCLAVMILLVGIEANLICDGDFQQHQIESDLSNNYDSASFDSDPSCWYRRESGKKYQINRANNQPLIGTTQLLDLMFSHSYYACQKIQLQINSTYQLNFSAAVNDESPNGQLKVFNNDAILLNCIVPNSSKVWFYSLILRPDTTTNQICFWGSSFNLSITTEGIMIDNVTLEQIIIDPNISNSSRLPIQLHISIDIRVSQVDGKVRFVTNLRPESEAEKKFLSLNAHLEIEGADQTTQCEQAYDQAGNLVIVWAPNNSINTMDYIITIGDYNDGTGKTYSFQIYYQQQLYFTYLNAKQRSLLSKVDPFALAVMQKVKKGTFLVSNVFCSYFIFNLLNFWNLALLYYFLQLSTLPIFASDLMGEMMKILLTKGNFMNWMGSFFGKKMYQIKGISALIERQKVAAFRNGKPWLGEYSITSNFIENNLDSMCLLVMMLIKIGLLRLVRTIMKKKQYMFAQKLFGEPKQDFHYLFMEFIVTIPFVSMSAITQIFSLNYYKKVEKLNASFQIVTLFFCIIILAIDFVSRKNLLIRSKKSKKNLKDREFREKLAQKQVKARIEQCESLLCLVLPVSLVMVDASLFMVLNGLTIFGRFYLYLKNFNKLRAINKIFLLPSLLIWVMYHSIFILLKIAQEDEQVMLFCEPNMKYLGFAVIIGIVVAALWEIFKLMVELVISLIVVLDKLRKHLFNNKIETNEDNGSQITYNIQIRKKITKCTKSTKNGQKKGEKPLAKTIVFDDQQICSRPRDKSKLKKKKKKSDEALKKKNTQSAVKFDEQGIVIYKMSEQQIRLQQPIISLKIKEGSKPNHSKQFKSQKPKIQRGVTSLNCEYSQVIFESDGTNIFRFKRDF